MPEIIIRGIGNTLPAQEVMASTIKERYGVDSTVVPPEPLAAKQDHRLSPEERQARIAAAFDNISEAVDKITTGEDWQRYLDVQAKFHHYSARNVLWLMAQAEDRKMQLSNVAGFHTWRKLGRQVDKGVHGFRVLAPVTFNHTKTDKEMDADRVYTGEMKSNSNIADSTKTVERRIAGFRVETVFDVSQTSGPPETLPTPPVVHKLEGEAPVALKSAVRAEIDQLGYKIKMANAVLEGWSEDQNGATMPQVKIMQIRDDLTHPQEIKTLLHELAHITMEHTGSDSHSETEAESVAYIVCHNLGIDSGDYSFGYVAGWATSTATVQASAENIRRTSLRLIERLDERLKTSTPQNELEVLRKTKPITTTAAAVSNTPQCNNSDRYKKEVSI